MDYPVNAYIFRNAFVTGGSGAIGRNLLPMLRVAGIKLRVLRRSTDVPCAESEIVDGDIRDFKPDWLEDIDVVFHLAAKTIPSYGSSMNDVNANGTYELVQAMQNTKHKPRLVFTSSVAVYGPSTDGFPMSSNSPTRPITDYGRSKLKAETIVLEYGNAVIARLPMVVGPGDRVTGRFKKLTRLGIFPVAPGRFCAIGVGDVVRLLYNLATSNCGVQHIYTVSDGEIYDWKNVSEHFAREQGKGVRLFNVPEVVLRQRLFALLGNSDAAVYLKHDWICCPNYPEGFSIEKKVFKGGCPEK